MHPPEATMLPRVSNLCGLPPAAYIVVGGVKVRLHLLHCIMHKVHACKVLLWHMTTCLCRSVTDSQGSNNCAPRAKLSRPPYLYLGILLERQTHPSSSTSASPSDFYPLIHRCSRAVRPPGANYQSSAGSGERLRRSVAPYTNPSAGYQP